MEGVRDVDADAPEFWISSLKLAPIEARVR